MARHAHPSSHGRLILRSLVDSPSPAEQPDEPERGALDVPVAASLASVQTTRKVHPGQVGAAPLGGAPGRLDSPRLPSGNPHVAHVGQAERSVKPPRSSTSRDTGGRIGGSVRPKR